MPGHHECRGIEPEFDQPKCVFLKHKFRQKHTGFFETGLAEDMA